jgi:hypothetical protein
LNRIRGGEYKDDCLLGCLLITTMMKAASTSETSVNFYQTTWRNILEDSHLYSNNFDEQYKLWSSSLCNFLQPLVNSVTDKRNIFLCVLPKYHMDPL